MIKPQEVAFICLHCSLTLNRVFMATVGGHKGLYICIRIISVIEIINLHSSLYNHAVRHPSSHKIILISPCSSHFTHYFNYVSGKLIQRYWVSFYFWLHDFAWYFGFKWTYCTYRTLKSQTCKKMCCRIPWLHLLHSE